MIMVINQSSFTHESHHQPIILNDSLTMTHKIHYVIHYHIRRFGSPRYVSTAQLINHHGPADEPAWTITYHYWLVDVPSIYEWLELVDSSFS